MKKTILIATVIGFILALGFPIVADCADRSAGQCSYHGGVDKDTGKCKDGTAIGAVSAPKEKPDPAIAAKAKACKAATSKYNSLANSATWKKIQSQMLGDSADDCSDSWDDKYAPKIAACKTDACRNGYQATLNKKYSACEVKELWALDWETKVTKAEEAKNAACN